MKRRSLVTIVEIHSLDGAFVILRGDRRDGPRCDARASHPAISYIISSNISEYLRNRLTVCVTLADSVPISAPWCKDYHKDTFGHGPDRRAMNIDLRTCCRSKIESYTSDASIVPGAPGLNRTVAVLDPPIPTLFSYHARFGP
ncbi:hypothetical protein EVAR_68992_1 [Eumeta japonica]|uniref:Uncharacterized protein n=1 Tax=Eumeta variegata TaxID=151549 RepID=A0A4C1ZZB9_EUMVA|nr:hypothetical protein EVAR_68992_1 [Eumeta japonica]